ncbi:ABC transporter permease [Methanimicrococcus blatticola]|uniref:Putative ABC transport system permease protein n=2 Tax=Methanimicrococcus blatticola TaxID=91560 RepID=A0A484F4P7_9EURY|nr:ABC transporter permease [Methanimicrococcus blatticola]MBZ3935839.1 ABC transporter permease [Methanimicrococcus blatticola]TDQ68877.1 putative ABC transport system permease protein [Methanimicrococcus blatticola]
MMIDLAYSTNMAVASLKSSKLRSGLTALGIIIGIAAVIATLTLGSSFGDYFSSEVDASGSNYIAIGAYKEDLLHEQQIDVIRNSKGVVDVSPVVGASADVEFMGETKTIEIYGVTEDYQNVTSVTIEEGSFITDKDSFMAVIGHDTAVDEFKNELGTGSRITMTVKNENNEDVTRTFTIKGVMETPASMITIGSYKTIYVPIEVLQEMTGKDFYSSVYATAESMEALNETEEEIKLSLMRNLGISQREYDNRSAVPLYFINQADLIEEVNGMVLTIQYFLLAIGSISLIVGSVGIMNIMFVTVTERTKEIGTLKALGYTSKDVLVLFLVESVIISGLGGFAGALIGLIISYIGAVLLGMPAGFPLSMLFLGIFISMVIGIIAGVYPARRAAKMNPVDALRTA